MDERKGNREELKMSNIFYLILFEMDANKNFFAFYREELSDDGDLGNILAFRSREKAQEFC